MTERGQISVAAVGLLLLVVLAACLVGTLGGINSAGARAQRAADMAALAAGRSMAADPSAGQAALVSAAVDAARANGADLRSLDRIVTSGVPGGVEIEVTMRVDAAGRTETLQARARAAVSFAAQLPAGTFRPVDLHGLGGRAAVVQAASAQVGWPYVWGGESRAEGGFDCSGLIDYSFAAAGAPLPGRPTAADLWHMGQPIAAAELQPGDLVFLGAPSGVPYHVGMYVGAGTVLAAPHTGAVVGYSPLAAGGWDGFARLLPPGPALADDAVNAAARAHGVPPHVIAAELQLGLARDAATAAAQLARAQAGAGGSLERALAAQLSSASAAALVLREGSGPGLAMSSQVRLVPVSQSSTGSSALPVPPILGLRSGDGRSPPAGGSWLNRVGTALGAGEHALAQLGERGRAVPLQAAAGIEHLSRFGLTGLSAFLPDPSLRDLAGMAGSAWDAAGTAIDLAGAAGRTGLGLGGAGLWAARLSVLGGAVSTLMYAGQAWTARSRRDRIGNGLMTAGSAATTAGMMTAGGSLLALGTGTAVVPPVGLCLIGAGATLCVAGYLVEHPRWCNSAVRVGGRVLDVAWQAQTAPVRVAAGVAGKVADGARSVIGSIPTPW